MFYHNSIKSLTSIEENIAKTYIFLMNYELYNRSNNLELLDRLLNDLKEYLKMERLTFQDLISNVNDVHYTLDTLMSNQSMPNVGGMFEMDAQKYFFDKPVDVINTQTMGMHCLYCLLNYRLIAYQNLEYDKHDTDITSSLSCNVYFMKEMNRVLSLILYEYIEKHCNNFYQSRLMRIKYLNILYTTINEEEMMKSKFDVAKIEPVNLEKKLMSLGYTNKEVDKFIKFVCLKTFKNVCRRLLSFSDEAFCLNEVIVESLIYQAYIRTLMLQIKDQDYVNKLQKDVINNINTLGTAISLNKAKVILIEAFSHYKNDCINHNVYKKQESNATCRD